MRGRVSSTLWRGRLGFVFAFATGAGGVSRSGRPAARMCRSTSARTQCRPADTHPRHARRASLTGKAVRLARPPTAQPRAPQSLRDLPLLFAGQGRHQEQRREDREDPKFDVTDPICASSEQVTHQRDHHSDDRQCRQAAEDVPDLVRACGGGLLYAVLGDTLQDLDLAFDACDQLLELGDIRNPLPEAELPPAEVGKGAVEPRSCLSHAHVDPKDPLGIGFQLGERLWRLPLVVVECRQETPIHLHEQGVVGPVELDEVHWDLLLSGNLTANDDRARVDTGDEYAARKLGRLRIVRFERAGYAYQLL